MSLQKYNYRIYTSLINSPSCASTNLLWFDLVLFILYSVKINNFNLKIFKFLKIMHNIKMSTSTGQNSQHGFRFFGAPFWRARAQIRFSKRFEKSWSSCSKSRLRNYSFHRCREKTFLRHHRSRWKGLLKIFLLVIQRYQITRFFAQLANFQAKTPY